ncbi:hypothetical protein CALCODRAFT_43436 [Calocera cornea HHB12733]|uniref:Uncharacterized protein n=1 Tax=Calocera cornea HHB12733 TaxID=1353952 RepID=A0A165DVL1_9BASI|nr:hypothetical protein CALCODRAFT_43436 [Calocera cornea HHB12733]
MTFPNFELDKLNPLFQASAINYKLSKVFINASDDPALRSYTDMRKLATDLKKGWSKLDKMYEDVMGTAEAVQKVEELEDDEPPSKKTRFNDPSQAGPPLSTRNNSGRPPHSTTRPTVQSTGTSTPRYARQSPVRPGPPHNTAGRAHPPESTINRSRAAAVRTTVPTSRAATAATKHHTKPEPKPSLEPVITIDSDDEEEAEDNDETRSYRTSPSLGSPLPPRRQSGQQVKQQEQHQDPGQEYLICLVAKYLASGKCHWPVDGRTGMIDWVKFAANASVPCMQGVESC